jgi:hypothetical protein
LTESDIAQAKEMIARVFSDPAPQEPDSLAREDADPMAANEAGVPMGDIESQAAPAPLPASVRRTDRQGPAASADDPAAGPDGMVPDGENAAIGAEKPQTTTARGDLVEVASAVSVGSPGRPRRRGGGAAPV